MPDWTPPPHGTPVRIAIPAKDVDRSAQFYKTVFNVVLPDPQPGPEIRLFSCGPASSIFGYIADSEAEFIPGGTCVFWYVDDIDAIGPVIEKAGGKMIGDKFAAGPHVTQQHFKDCEGVDSGVYQYKVEAASS